MRFGLEGREHIVNIEVTVYGGAVDLYDLVAVAQSRMIALRVICLAPVVVYLAAEAADARRRYDLEHTYHYSTHYKSEQEIHSRSRNKDDHALPKFGIAE